MNKRCASGSLPYRKKIEDIKNKRRISSPEEIQVLIKYNLDEFIRR